MYRLSTGTMFRMCAVQTGWPVCGRGILYLPSFSNEPVLWNQKLP